MEVITSSLLRKFSENLSVKNKTVLTKPQVQSPRKYAALNLVQSIANILEIQLLIDLDVVRPINDGHSSTRSRTGLGPYECLICAATGRYFRYTRKMTYQDHFEKHTVGRVEVIRNSYMKMYFR